MGNLLRDVSHALRLLAKAPTFTLAAVLTLAIGIGVTTSIFSALDAVLVKPLPYRDPDSLVVVWERHPSFPRNSVSVATFLDWKEQNRVFERMAARSGRSFVLTGGDQPERVSGALVSPDYFEVLGVGAEWGRTFASGEDLPGDNRVVILTHRTWQERFGADRTLIGKTIILDGQLYTVLGVLEPQPIFDRAPEQIYAPLDLLSFKDNRSSHFLRVYARLRPGIDLLNAQAEMDAIARDIAERYPMTNRGWGVTLDRLADLAVRKELRQAILALFGAVLFVLLIACANLGNLTLARTAHRGREFSIRAAIGAGPGRLAAQLLAESLVLALLGGALGAMASLWLVDLFQARMPAGMLPPQATLALDFRTFSFGFTLAALCGIAVGLLPAWQVCRGELAHALRRGEGGQSITRSGRMMTRLLVVSEVALALMLLIGSGLLIRTLFQLQRAELGFDPHNILTMHINLPSTRYASPDARRAFFDEALRRVRVLPGVQYGGLVTDLPIVGWTYGVFFQIEGQPLEPSQRPAAHQQVITPGYFEALAVPIVRGRAFTEADQAAAPPVAIINQALARRFFVNDDPIGKRIAWNEPPRMHEIVGVAADVRVYGLGDRLPEENPEVYVPYAQNPSSAMFLALRSSGAPMNLVAAVRRELAAVDAAQPVTSVRSMDEVVSASLEEERFQTSLLGLFSVVALTLAAIGIYGVVSYGVTQRTREMGIRIALGATRGDVLRLVLGQEMRIVGIGLALGLVGAVAIGSALQGLLYKTSRMDPTTILVALPVLVAITLLACWIPARRAARTNPLAALRYE